MRLKYFPNKERVFEICLWVTTSPFLFFCITKIALTKLYHWQPQNSKRANKEKRREEKQRTAELTKQVGQSRKDVNIGAA